MFLISHFSKSIYPAGAAGHGICTLPSRLLTPRACIYVYFDYRIMRILWIIVHKQQCISLDVSCWRNWHLKMYIFLGWFKTMAKHILSFFFFFSISIYTKQPWSKEANWMLNTYAITSSSCEFFCLFIWSRVAGHLTTILTHNRYSYSYSPLI